MLNISESQRKVLRGWAIVGVIILVIVSIFALVTVKEKSAKENDGITAVDSKKVIDRSRYYTVKNAITKYYSYVNMKDYDSVLKILDSTYLSENNIDENSIKSQLEENEVALSYDSKIMCLKNSNKGVYTFVVNGNEISANTGKVIAQRYYEITMDGNNSTFSLKQIEESIYNEVCNG